MFPNWKKKWKCISPDIQKELLEVAVGFMQAENMTAAGISQTFLMSSKHSILTLRCAVDLGLMVQQLYVASEGGVRANLIETLRKLHIDSRCCAKHKTEHDLLLHRFLIKENVF